MSDVETQFKAALNVIQSLPKNGSYKPSPNMMLHFYSLYKQATEGRCNRTKPWSFDIVNKAKWEAWNKLGDMSKEEAMRNYVVELTKIIEALPATDKAADFIETLGNFYEIVDPQSENAKEFKKFTDSRKMNGNHSIPNGNTGSSPANGNSAPETEDSQDDDDNKRSSGSENDEESSSDSDYIVKIANTLTGKEYSVSEANLSLQANDSDDEFCDTSADMTNISARDGDHSGSQSVSTLSSTSGTPPRNTDKLLNEVNPPLIKQPLTRGGEKGTHGVDESVRTDQNNRGQIPHVTSVPRPTLYSPTTQVQSTSGGSGEDRNPADNNRQSEVQERIAVALLQLQRDMHSVLNRLTTLETITIARHQDAQLCHQCFMRGSEKEKTSWWIFDELSPKTTIFLLIWPFLARLLISMWTKRIRKRS